MKKANPTLVPALVTLAFAALAVQAAAADPLDGDPPLALQALGDPTEEDPILKFAKENGFGGIDLAPDCVSVIDGGPTLDGEGVSELPVGGGRRLECSIDVQRTVAKFILDSNDEPWCQLGQQTDFLTRALDDRLSVSVESAPASGPWSVVATHDGDEITVIRASNIWPLGVESNYDTIDLQPALGRTCEQVFGL